MCEPCELVTVHTFSLEPCGRAAHSHTPKHGLVITEISKTPAGEATCLKKQEKLTFSLVERENTHNTKAQTTVHACEESSRRSSHVALNTVKKRQLDWFQFLVNAPRLLSNSFLFFLCTTWHYDLLFFAKNVLKNKNCFCCFSPQCF